VLGKSRFIRLAEQQRREIRFTIDGHEAPALAGDTLMVAILANTQSLRHSEFGAEVRSGFCLMGACQDCWVRDEEGKRMRACTTLLVDGMRIRTTREESTWPTDA
jgi:predicted molibdopterin-dependent oxidoreductase YjgC